MELLLNPWLWLEMFFLLGIVSVLGGWKLSKEPNSQSKNFRKSSGLFTEFVVTSIVLSFTSVIISILSLLYRMEYY